MRDGRKTVLFVSEGMAGTIPPGISTTGSTAMGSSTTVGTSRESSFANSASLLGDLVEVFRAAARNNTSIYTLDPRGLAGSEFDINDTVASQLDRQVLNEIDRLAAHDRQQHERPRDRQSQRPAGRSCGR